MYDELVKSLRELCDMTALCDDHSCFECPCEEECSSYKNGRLSAVYRKAADAIEQLSNAWSAYGRGWTLGYDAGREESKPRWISVEEALPENNQVVVVVQRGKTWDYGQFRGLAYLGGNIHKWNWKNNTTKTVDYWMPKKSALPEPTEEE